MSDSDRARTVNLRDLISRMSGADPGRITDALAAAAMEELVEIGKACSSVYDLHGRLKELAAAEPVANREVWLIPVATDRPVDLQLAEALFGVVAKLLEQNDLTEGDRQRCVESMAWISSRSIEALKAGQ